MVYRRVFGPSHAYLGGVLAPLARGLLRRSFSCIVRRSSIYLGFLESDIGLVPGAATEATLPGSKTVPAAGCSFQ